MPTRLEPKVEIAFGTPPRSSSPVWIDVTDSVLEISTVKRGRRHELDRFEAGTGQLTLDNSDRRYDPTYTGSRFYPNVRPMRRVRISGIGPMPATLTVSGNEITDATRTTNAQGDGRSAPDSSFGIWPASTNLIANGGFETNTTGWALAGAATIARSSAQTKFGSQSLRVVASAAGGGAYLPSFIAVSPSTAYTFSVWVAPDAGGTPIRIRWDEYTSASAFITSRSTTLATPTVGWQRVTVTGTTDAAAAFAQPVVDSPTAAQGFYLDGVQLEASSVATPYIHTDGATATRAAARVQAPSTLLNAPQSWIAARVRAGLASSGAPTLRLLEWSKDASNYFVIDYAGGWRLLRQVAGAGAIVSVSQTFALGDLVTVVASWDAGNLYLSINGGAFTHVANASIPAGLAALFDIGTAPTFSGAIDGDVLWFACGTGTLTDSTAGGKRNDVATLNALGNTDPDFSTLPPAAQVTGTMPFSTSSYSALTTVPKFTGYVLEWPPDWSGVDYSETTVQLTDGIGTLSMSRLTGTFSQQLTGARINAVLDAVGWPAADRVISTGLSTVVAATFVATDNVMAWSHMQDVADTENGLAFIDSQGRFVFRDRQTQLTAPYTTSQFTFDDTLGGANLYDDLDPSEDDDLLYTDVTVTDNSGAASTFSDATAQDEYWPRSFTRSTLLPTGSPERDDAARYLLSLHKDPAVRFRSLDYIPTLNDTLATQTLTREIGDRMTVKKTPPGPPPQVSRDVVIQSIEDRIVPGAGAEPTWTTVYELAPADGSTYAVLDSTAVLDSSSCKLAY